MCKNKYQSYDKFIAKSKEHERRINKLEKFMKKFQRVECRFCKQLFWVDKKEYSRLSRQKLSIYCPYQRHVAIK